MEVKQVNSGNRVRAWLHVSSISYLVMLLIMVVNQSSFFDSILRKHFKLKIGNVILFFSTDDWVDNLSSNLKLMVTDMLLLVTIEVLLIVAGLVLIGFLFWQLKKQDRWHFSEKLVGLGYLFLVSTLLLILSKMTMASYQTYETITNRLISLSVSELAEIKDSLQEIVFQSNVTLDNVIPNFIGLLDQLKLFVNKTQAIADIPMLLERTWQTLFVLKNWLIGCSAMAILAIVVGHVIEGVAHLNLFNQVRERVKRRRVNRQLDVNERLVEVVEQQAELIKLLAEKEIKN